jgi:hypothetical protein
MGKLSKEFIKKLIYEALGQEPPKLHKNKIKKIIQEEVEDYYRPIK